MKKKTEEKMTEDEDGMSLEVFTAMAILDGIDKSKQQTKESSPHAPNPSKPPIPPSFQKAFNDI